MMSLSYITHIIGAWAIQGRGQRKQLYSVFDLYRFFYNISSVVISYPQSSLVNKFGKTLFEIDLIWAAVLGGRLYWEGGSIGREAVLGGRRYWEGGNIRREAILGGRRYWEGGCIGREDCNDIRTPVGRGQYFTLH